MKQSDRFTLIDRIARELQSRYKTYEIGPYLKSFGIDVPASNEAVYSKWVYAKSILAEVSPDTVIKIADDLNLNAAAIVIGASLPPKHWEATSHFRLFISHISADKENAKRLRDCLLSHAISGFVAHEDIMPTREWEQELLRGLHTMDAFLAMHTIGFAASNWTQQEIGFAVCRGVKIISFKMGEDPTGFLSQRQALLRKGRTAEAVAKEIANILADDPITRDRLASAKHASRSNLDDEIPF